MKHTSSPGYIAITTAIIVTIMLSLLAASLVFGTLVSRQNQVGVTNKQQSLYAAHGCLEQGLLNLSLSSTYQGNESMTIGSGATAVTCNLLAITTQGSNKLLKAKATVNGATTNLTLTVDSTSLARISLQENTTL